MFFPGVFFCCFFVFLSVCNPVKTGEWVLFWSWLNRARRFYWRGANAIAMCVGCGHTCCCSRCAHDSRWFRRCLFAHGRVGGSGRVSSLRISPRDRTVWTDGHYNLPVYQGTVSTDNILWKDFNWAPTSAPSLWYHKKNWDISRGEKKNLGYCSVILFTFWKGNCLGSENEYKYILSLTFNLWGLIFKCVQLVWFFYLFIFVNTGYSG